MRVFDAFGSDTVNTRIGASIRPEDRAVPTSFSCWFTSAGIAFSTGKVTATLWSVSNTRGSHPMATVELSAQFFFSSPTQQSTTTFSFPSGLSAFNTVVGTDVYRYVVARAAATAVPVVAVGLGDAIEGKRGAKVRRPTRQ